MASRIRDPGGSTNAVRNSGDQAGNTNGPWPGVFGAPPIWCIRLAILMTITRICLIQNAGATTITDKIRLTVFTTVTRSQVRTQTICTESQSFPKLNCILMTSHKDMDHDIKTQRRQTTQVLFSDNHKDLRVCHISPSFGKKGFSKHPKENKSSLLVTAARAPTSALGAQRSLAANMILYVLAASTTRSRPLSGALQKV